MFAPKRILVPTDFSDNSDEALKQALELAKQYKAKVYFLHVTTPVNLKYGATTTLFVLTITVFETICGLQSFNF
jgi:nucleotide-binding universal stress UspA family protein